MGVGMAIYLWESLQSPKWLILKVAQPQVPPSKKSETYYVRFCVCVLTQQDWEQKRREGRVVVKVVWWYSGV